MEDQGNPQQNPCHEPLFPHQNPLYHDGNRPLQEYLYPTGTSIPSCIMFPPNTAHQEFIFRMIQLLPTLHELENEKGYVHIREFEEVVTTFQGHPHTLDTVRLKFVPFSLKDKAKVWLYSLRSGSIETWDEMTTTFFHKQYNHKLKT